MSGFLTSYNSFVVYFGKRLGNIEFGKITIDLYNECKKNKEDYIANAVSRIMINYLDVEPYIEKLDDSYIKRLDDSN